jgi:hypothetical protein
MQDFHHPQKFELQPYWNKAASSTSCIGLLPVAAPQI